MIFWAKVAKTCLAKCLIFRHMDRLLELSSENSLLPKLNMSFQRWNKSATKKYAVKPVCPNSTHCFTPLLSAAQIYPGVQFSHLNVLPGPDCRQTENTILSFWQWKENCKKPSFVLSSPHSCGLLGLGDPFQAAELSFWQKGGRGRIYNRFINIWTKI